LVLSYILLFNCDEVTINLTTCNSVEQFIKYIENLCEVF